MSKTAREVLTEQMFGPSPGAQLTDAEADALIADLDAAGFVIVPKEPTEAMCMSVDDYDPYHFGAGDALIVYRTMLAAAVSK